MCVCVQDLHRLILGRLEPIAEEVLPESQRGFHKWRGCVDMVFASRQLIEKGIEHPSELHIPFVDPRKAYDSVHRSVLCMVLKFGVPPRMLNIIRSLHNGMSANGHVRGGVSEAFGVRNGLRQQCTSASLLFNLYLKRMLCVGV